MGSGIGDPTSASRTQARDLANGLEPVLEGTSCRWRTASRPRGGPVDGTAGKDVSDGLRSSGGDHQFRPDLAKKLTEGGKSDAGQMADVYAHLIAAHKVALTAQTDQQQMQATVAELEAELERIRAFRSEAKSQYQPTTLDAMRGSCFVYAYKGEPPHWLCAHCFDRDTKSVLQFQGHDRSGEAVMECPGCHGKLTVMFGAHPEPA